MVSENNIESLRSFLFNELDENGCKVILMNMNSETNLDKLYNSNNRFPVFTYFFMNQHSQSGPKKWRWSNMYLIVWNH